MYMSELEYQEYQEEQQEKLNNRTESIWLSILKERNKLENK
tara:strand:- start:6575 stop:6697 length:123 start_codon:yes stop_codon:yes gene_type:complete